MDCKSFGVYAFRSAEIKEECSSEDSECFKKEGTFAVDSFLVFYYINARNL